MASSPASTPKPLQLRFQVNVVYALGRPLADQWLHGPVLEQWRLVVPGSPLADQRPRGPVHEQRRPKRVCPLQAQWPQGPPLSQRPLVATPRLLRLHRLSSRVPRTSGSRMLLLSRSHRSSGMPFAGCTLTLLTPPTKIWYASSSRTTRASRPSWQPSPSDVQAVFGHSGRQSPARRAYHASVGLIP